MNSSILDPLVFEPELGGQILCIGGPYHGRIQCFPPFYGGQACCRLASHHPDGGYYHPLYELRQVVIAQGTSPIWVLIESSVTVNQKSDGAKNPSKE